MDDIKTVKALGFANASILAHLMRQLENQKVLRDEQILGVLSAAETTCLQTDAVHKNDMFAAAAGFVSQAREAYLSAELPSRGSLRS